MTNNNFNSDKIIEFLWYTMFVFLFIILTPCCQSCTTTKYVTVPEYHTDTLYKARKDSIKWNVYTHIKDSVSLRDSIVLRINGKGDIIGKDTWHWRERFVNEKDSTFFYKSKIDSIYKPYKVVETKEVNKLYWWQNTLIWIGVISIIILVITIILKIKKIN